MGSGGKALRDGQQRPFMSSAGSPRSLRGALMQPFGGDASRPLCPGSEVEGSGEGWGGGEEHVAANRRYWRWCV